MTCVAYLFVPNDFWLNKPDGTVLINLTDAAADLFVCPAPGAIDCIIEYLYANPSFPAPLPGMLTGTAKITSVGQVTPTYEPGCPTTTQSVGTVSDAAGGTYNFRHNLIIVKNHDSEAGCEVMRNNIILRAAP